VQRRLINSFQVVLNFLVENYKDRSQGKGQILSKYKLIITSRLHRNTDSDQVASISDQ